MSHAVELVAGMTAGAATAAILHPLDTVKVRFQAFEGRTGLQSGGPYASSLALVAHVVRTEGPLALYRGVVPATVASGFAWGAYLGMYSFYKPLLSTWPQGNLLAAVASGATCVVLTNPLWLIKLRVQLDATQQGPLAAAAGILRKDGVAGLFRGLVPALLLTSNGAIQLAAYEELKAMNRAHRGSQGDTFEHLVMGAGSKIVATLVTYPLQVAKTRMQREVCFLAWRHAADSAHAQRQASTSAEYAQLTRTMALIYKREGARGFYKGITANMLRSAPNSALIFAIYEAVKDRLGAFIS